MPFVGFEPTIPASERAKTVHALNRSATVTGSHYLATGFLPRIGLCGKVFIEPLPGNGSIRHSIYCL
jgi:hypothetical protein